MAKRPSSKNKTGSGKKKVAKKRAVAKKVAREKAPAKKKVAKAALISGDSPDYPPYILTFEGSLIPDPPLTVRGVHTTRFAGPPAVTLDVTHNETDFGIPNLTFRLNRE